MAPLELDAVVYQEGKYIVAQCLNVDISSFGKSVAEALDNLREALELYFSDDDSQEPILVERPGVYKLTLARA